MPSLVPNHFMESELITEVPDDFVRAFQSEILGKIPQEKIRVGLNQARIARVMAQAGSVYVPGIGQKKAEIDARLYFRMLHDFGGEENWLDDLLADNPDMVAPGYNAKSKPSLRHGKTFIGGAPV